MITASRVFILPPPLCKAASHRPILSATRHVASFPDVGRYSAESRMRLVRGQGFRDQGIHLGKIAAHVLPAVDDEGWVTAQAAKQGLEEAFDRGGVHQPHRDARPEQIGRASCRE